MSWSRRDFLVRSSAVVAGGLALPRMSWAQAPAAADTTFTALRRNVGFFTGRGGTMGWLTAPDGVIVVDSQFPDTAQACVDGLKSRAPRGIDVLINTHHHGDHTGGNGVFRPLVKKIVAHARVPDLQRKQAGGQAGAPPPTVADTLFETTWRMEVGDEVVRATYYGPAHTSGDAVITFEKAEVAHMGDLVFHQRHPFIDRPAGASISGWITVLERAVADHPSSTLFIFGHAKQGVPVTGGAAQLTAFRDYLSALLDFTQKAIAAGKSREAIVATTTLPGYADYATAPPMLTLERVLGVAYDELAAK
jgi:glyoxylase-like metal-dependent hydrolase (beta-lactamase superfamily II)